MLKAQNDEIGSRIGNTKFSFNGKLPNHQYFQALTCSVILFGIDWQICFIFRGTDTW